VNSRKNRQKSETCTRAFSTSKQRRDSKHHAEHKHAKNGLHVLTPKISVVGIGGCGGNSINNMAKKSLTGVEFISCNTDTQSLSASEAGVNIQLGRSINNGLGAGARPEIGRQAAEESLEEVMNAVGDSHMVFITAGMGGGTGTGAAPVIAEACKRRGILTVAIAVTPFEMEGQKRMETALKGIEVLQNTVDTMVIIPNQKLLKTLDKTIPYQKSLEIVNDVLYRGVQCISDLIVRPGLINLDFADIKAVMEDAGRGMIGTGEAEGPTRARTATQMALRPILLDNLKLTTVQRALVHVTAGPDCGLNEIKQVGDIIYKEIDSNANIIFGASLAEGMDNKMKVSLILTGVEEKDQNEDHDTTGVLDRLRTFIREHW
jgi:cell division protein FtsZ